MKNIPARLTILAAFICQSLTGCFGARDVTLIDSSQAPSPTSPVLTAISPGYKITQTSTPSTITTVPIQPTLIPTFTAKEALEYFSDLIGSPECQAPCLWGIIPGESLGNEYYYLINRTGTIDTETIHTEMYEFSRGDSLSISYLSSESSRVIFDLSIYHDMRAIEFLDLYISVIPHVPNKSGKKDYSSITFGEDVRPYMLASILIQYGAPDEIKLIMLPDDDPNDRIDWHPFDLLLYYKNDGMLVHYSNQYFQDGDFYLACPHQGEIKIQTWSPEMKYTIHTIMATYGWQFSIENIDRDYKSIDDATGMSISEFTAFYRDPNHLECIRTSKILWP
jgi:hypothetical protein